MFEVKCFFLFIFYKYYFYSAKVHWIGQKWLKIFTIL